MLITRLTLLLVALSTPLALALPAQAEPEFTPLGQLPFGGTGSVSTGISTDGTVVIGIANPAGSGFPEAFRWTAGGGLVGLGDLPLSTHFSTADGLSADGSTVVGMGTSGSGNEAYLWTSAVGMTPLGDLTGGIFHSGASDVSADGSVVVGTSDGASGMEAFRWTSGTGLVGLGDLPGGSFRSEARGISADGSVIVGVSKSTLGTGGNGSEAFLWTAGGGIVGLGDLPGGDFESEAWGVSDDGTTVVGSGGNSAGRTEAIRWTSGLGMQGLGFLSGIQQSIAYAASADGSVVVGYSGGVVSSSAFVWDPVNGMRNIQTLLQDAGVDLTGYSIQKAYSVSGDGRVIVGEATGPGGKEAWRAVLPRCGDALIEDAELCDDGNLSAGDGCDEVCSIEPGWSCNGEPSVCAEPTVPVLSLLGQIGLVVALLLSCTAAFGLRLRYRPS